MNTWKKSGTHDGFPLCQLEIGDVAVVEQVLSEGNIRRRLMDLGLITGTRVTCLHKSPAGNPVAYEIRGSVIALRNEDSAGILVKRGEPKWG